MASFVFLNKYVKYSQILMVFGTWNPEKILHQQLIEFSTARVSYSRFTLGNPKSQRGTVVLQVITGEMASL